MSKKMTTLLVAVLLLNTALAGGALYLANLTKPVDYGDAGNALAGTTGDITEVAGYEPDAAAGDVAVALSAMQRGGNFRIDFTASKTAGGRHVEHEGTWDELTGAVVYRPEAQALVAVEVTFGITSMRTDALPLTNTVLSGEKWFDYENHPTAVFACDTVAEIIPNAVPADPNAPTHALEGQFTINGITKDIAIPAKLTFTGQTLTLDADFEILRSDYGVEKREGSLAGTAGGAVSEVDDAVQLRVRMTVSPDPSAVIAELAGVVEAQTVQLTEFNGLLSQMENRLRTVEAWESRIGAGSGISGVDISGLPESFTDFSPVYVKTKLPDGSASSTLDRYAAFDMVLVPGSEDRTVTPLYMSKLEVTWELFRAWSECIDVLDVDEVDRLIRAGLRPTPLFGNPSILVQINNTENPARAVSRLTAEAFCKWLTEQTGRRYRLPTEREWEHALVTGGGVPDDIGAACWHFDNAPYDEFFGSPARNPAEMVEVPAAGTKPPNSLGIHDLLGSVSEWVIPENPAERALRGGNMRTRTHEMTLDWREVEEPDGWFAAYPNRPRSRFWYPSYEFGGIRLVCEAQSVLENPPTGETPAE